MKDFEAVVIENVDKGAFPHVVELFVAASERIPEGAETFVVEIPPTPCKMLEEELRVRETEAAFMKAKCRRLEGHVFRIAYNIGLTKYVPGAEAPVLVGEALAGLVEEAALGLRLERDEWKDTALNNQSKMETKLEYYERELLKWRDKALEYDSEAGDLETETDILRAQRDEAVARLAEVVKAVDGMSDALAASLAVAETNPAFMAAQLAQKTA